MANSSGKPDAEDFTASLLMTVYHGSNPDWLEVALDSIVNQTRLVDEYVIVYDGPVSKTIVKLVEQYLGSNDEINLNVIQLPKNEGLCKALSIGVQACSKNFIIRMDDDDVSLPDRFDALAKAFAETPNFDVIGTQICEFEENRTLRLRTVPINQVDIERKMRFRNAVNHVTVCMRRSAILAAGNYQNESAGGFEDFILWHNLLSRGAKFRNLTDVHVLVRFSRHQISRRRGFRYLQIEFNVFFELYKNHQVSLESFVYFLFVRCPSRLLPNLVLILGYRTLFRRRYALPDSSVLKLLENYSINIRTP
jgi:glycosyltransferase involved in cell wall biosynthesis